MIRVGHDGELLHRALTDEAVILNDAGEVREAGRDVERGERNIVRQAEAGGRERVQKFVPVGDDDVDLMGAHPLGDQPRQQRDLGEAEDERRDALGFGQRGLFDEHAHAEGFFEAGLVFAGGGEADASVAELAEAAHGEAGDLKLIAGYGVEVRLEVKALDLHGAEVVPVEVELLDVYFERR